MPRIANINIPDEKQVEVALTYIYGVGQTRAREALKATQIALTKRAKDLTDAEAHKLQEFITKNYKVEGQLREEVRMNIKRLKDIRCYRGVRHAKGLPVRGQQTRTNTRTVRGNVRHTVATGRRPPADFK